MRYLPFLALGVLSSGCMPNPDVLVMKEEPVSAGQRDTEFFVNGKLASQETSAVQDGRRTNVWRFYERGVLIREDLDSNFDGMIDTVKYYDPKTGAVVKLMRDLNYDGSFDSVVEYDGSGEAKPLPAPTNLSSSSSAARDEELAPLPRTPTVEPIRQPARAPQPTARPAVSSAMEDDSAAADLSSTYDATTAPAQPSNRRPASLQGLMADDTGTPAGASGLMNSGASAPSGAVDSAGDPVDGSVIQRITPPSRLNTVTPATTGRGVVPDATFQHPSGNLED